MHFLVSDDDEKDYSTKPEFYDTDLDDKDELWVQNKRKGRISDAVLSCPACVLLVLPPSALSAKRYEHLIAICRLKENQYMILDQTLVLEYYVRVN